MRPGIALTNEVMVERLRYRAALEEMREIVIQMVAQTPKDQTPSSELTKLTAVLTKVGVVVRDK